MEEGTKAMTFEVTKIAVPERIEWNYEELKAEIAERVQHYETLVYTDETIKEAKADRANLNKLKKALNDERIRLEKEYMKPFAEFKAQVNEVIGIIDKPVAIIDAQIKRGEELKKQEKREEILAYLDTFALPYDMDARRIWSEKWLNATVSIKAVKAEIDERVTKIQEDLETLEGLDEFRDQAIHAYTETMDLREALEAQRKAKETKEKIDRWHRDIQALKDEPKDELPTVEIQPEPLPKIEAPKEPAPTDRWISFRVLVDLEKAKALRRFFDENNIRFERI